MQKLDRVSNTLSLFGLWFGGTLILLAALAIGCDVLMRKLLNMSIGGADELARYALAIGTTWSLAGALVARAHIRIDTLYNHFPRKMKLVLDFAALVLLLGFFGLVAWHSFGVAAQSWETAAISQSELEIPLIIPQALWVSGFVMFVGVGAITLVRALSFAVAKQPDEISRVIGTKSAIEETSEEIQFQALTKNKKA